MSPPRTLPRRVLMTADAVGGVWHYALELARGLSGSDIEVVLAVLGPPLHPSRVSQPLRSTVSRWFTAGSRSSGCRAPSAI